VRIKACKTTRVDRFREGRGIHQVWGASRSVGRRASRAQGGPVPKRSMMLAGYSRRAAMMVRSAIRHCQGEKRARCEGRREREPGIWTTRCFGKRPSFQEPRARAAATGINVRMSRGCNRGRVSSKSPNMDRAGGVRRTVQASAPAPASIASTRTSHRGFGARRARSHPGRSWTRCKRPCFRPEHPWTRG
jgi:hypothetical protein